MGTGPGTQAHRARTLAAGPVAARRRAGAESSRSAEDRPRPGRASASSSGTSARTRCTSAPLPAPGPAPGERTDRRAPSVPDGRLALTLGRSTQKTPGPAAGTVIRPSHVTPRRARRARRRYTGCRWPGFPSINRGLLIGRRGAGQLGKQIRPVGARQPLEPGVQPAQDLFPGVQPFPLHLRTGRHLLSLHLVQ